MNNIEKIKELYKIEEEYLAVKSKESFLQDSLKALNTLFLITKNTEEKADEELLETIYLTSISLPRNELEEILKNSIIVYSQEAREEIIEENKQEIIDELNYIYNNYNFIEESFLTDSLQVLKEVFLFTNNNDEDPEDCLQDLFFRASNTFDDKEETIIRTYQIIEDYIEAVINKIEVELSNEKNNI